MAATLRRRRLPRAPGRRGGLRPAVPRAQGPPRGWGGGRRHQPPRGGAAGGNAGPGSPRGPSSRPCPPPSLRASPVSPRAPCGPSFPHFQVTLSGPPSPRRCTTPPPAGSLSGCRGVWGQRRGHVPSPRLPQSPSRSSSLRAGNGPPADAGHGGAGDGFGRGMSGRSGTWTRGMSAPAVSLPCGMVWACRSILHLNSRSFFSAAF